MHPKPETWCLVDLGYRGLDKFHSATSLPIRKPHNKPLPPEAKRFNRRIAKLRWPIEYVVRKLKVFRILSDRYRARRHRFGLRVNLIAGIYNFELGLP